MNKSLKILDKEFLPYILSSVIENKIKQVAELLNSHYGQNTQPVVLLTVLGGAMMYSAELNKHLTFPLEWGFVKCSSYENSTTSSGEIKLSLPPTINPNGRDILVVEDIVDTGNTWEFLHDFLLKNGAKSIKITSLALKNTVYNKELPVDFVALELEDKFVVGYGLDYFGFGRNINGIYKLSTSAR